MDLYFHRFGEQLQVLAGAAAEGHLREFVTGIRNVAHELPNPVDFAESSVLEKLLREFVGHAANALGSGGVSVPSLEYDAPASDAFRQWARDLSSELPFLDSRRARTSAEMRHVLRAMQRGYDKPLRIQDLAGSLGWSVPYFCEMFKDGFGITAHQCLTRIRIAKAASLLRSGAKPDAVALLVGYHSPSRFYHTFRKMVGCTPGEFRRAAPCGPVRQAPCASVRAGR